MLCTEIRNAYLRNGEKNKTIDNFILRRYGMKV